MQKVVGIGGVFFRAKDPKVLARWYEDVLGVDIDNRTWVQERGQTIFTPFRADTDYFGSPDQQWMLCFRVNDLAAMLEQLRAVGITAIENPEWNSEVGVFARIHDPEENPIELWQPSDFSLGLM
jgi:predicted enzyme related to lactoylglutathione lyase